MKFSQLATVILLLFLSLSGNLAGQDISIEHFLPQEPDSTRFTKGAVSDLQYWGLVPIHMSMLSDGRILSFGTPVSDRDIVHFGSDITVWDPVSKKFAVQEYLFRLDAFCSAAIYLSNTLYIVGGNDLSRNYHLKAEGATQTVMLSDEYGEIQRTGEILLNSPRWYSTLLTLPDRRLLTLGGAKPYSHNSFNDSTRREISMAPEILETGAWREMTKSSSFEFFGWEANEWWYPKAYLAPDGKVFGVSGKKIWKLDVDKELIQGYGTTGNHFPGASGTSVMYEPGKIVLFAGGQRGNTDISGDSLITEQNGATNEVTLVDYKNGNIQTTELAPMKYPRSWATAAVLPTGEVAIIGGTQKWNSYDSADWVSPIEIWTPPSANDSTDSGTFRVAAQLNKPRLYHSSALLLADASILIGGGGLPPGDGWRINPANGSELSTRRGKYRNSDTPFRDTEIFYPPYLFDEEGNWAERPVITYISGYSKFEGYGSTISVKTTLPAGQSSIKEVSIIRIPSVTHGISMDQRFMNLPFSESEDGTLRISIPDNRNILPPGHYMVFVLDSEGVPSEALRINGQLLELY